MTRVEAATGPPGEHFFGYYEKSPWSADEQYLLAHQVTFDDRVPGPEDFAGVCLVHADDGTVETLSGTAAWNFQQGAMLQWRPGHEREVVYNDRARPDEDAEGFVARVHDVETDRTRTVESPIYALAPDGETAFTLDFTRLWHTRRGYGYAPPPDADAPDAAPTDGGVYRVDLESGERDQVLSLAVLALDADAPDGAVHWINHVQVAPDGERFACIHRWNDPDRQHGRGERLLAARADGSEQRVLADTGQVSHYDWRTPTELVAWTHEPDTGKAFHAYEVTGGDVEVFAPAVDRDGHNSFSPDGAWMLTDTYPVEGEQRLSLYDVERDTLHEVARFDAPPVENPDLRCDLHPRWDREGEKVCVDSRHGGGRQLYVVDVSDVTG